MSRFANTAVLLLAACPALLGSPLSSSGVLSAVEACADRHASASTHERPNEVVCENLKTGTPVREWDVNGAGDRSIQGFATAMAVVPGQIQRFKISTDATSYRVDIYRVGYYQGHGARKVSTVAPSAQLPQAQPPCDLSDEDTWLYDCDNWSESAVWRVPSDAVSGLYFARPTRTDEQPEDEVPWREDPGGGLMGGDPLHARPGTDPFKRPENLKHSYGRNGFGRLRNPLSEPRASHIFFVVSEAYSGSGDDNEAKRDASDHVEKGSDIVVQTSDTTWQAYNGYGGWTSYGSFVLPMTHGPDARWVRSLDEAKRRAHKMSYNRPLTSRDYRPVNSPFGSEVALIYFLEQQGYDVSYVSGAQVATEPDRLLRHRIFISSGHDEYWSALQRASVEAARDAGVHLVFLSGNEAYWKVRWEPDPAGHPERVVVCYKDTQSVKALDPVEWTGTWRDARPVNTEGPRPENALTGTLFSVNAQRNDALRVPTAFGRLRFWRNTSAVPGSSCHANGYCGPCRGGCRDQEGWVSPRGVLGHEFDSDFDNGFRPEGLIRLSETIVDNVEHIQDHGSVFGTGTGHHHMTLYRDQRSRALVWGAGTIQYAWGLAPLHDSNDPFRQNQYTTRLQPDEHAETVSPTLQQAFVNMMADMGDVQPATLSDGLVRAEMSRDDASPVSAIVSQPHSSEAEGSEPGKVVEGKRRTQVIVAATDVGGGVVAGVEVSYDGGKMWHPARRVLPDTGSRSTSSSSLSSNEDEARKEIQITSTPHPTKSLDPTITGPPSASLLVSAASWASKTSIDGGKLGNSVSELWVCDFGLAEHELMYDDVLQHADVEGRFPHLLVRAIDDSINVEHAHNRVLGDTHAPTENN